MFNFNKYYRNIKLKLTFYTHKDFEELYDDYQTKLEKIKIKYKNELNQKNKNHKNEVHNIKSDYDNKLNKINSVHQQEIESIEVSYNKSLEKIKEDYNNKQMRRNARYKDNLHQIEKNANNKLSEIKENYEKAASKFTLNTPRLKFIESSPETENKFYKIKFSISDEEIKKFIELKDLGKPTDEQWEVILCKNSTQLVAAAAGSGKSTTMLLRIVVLIKFANVNPEELIVFSFTKKSCEELREKLKKHFIKAGLSIYDTITEKMIRTFHSKVYEAAKDSGLLGSYKLFEFIKNKDDENTNTVIDVDVDNNFNSSNLSYMQKNILKQVYSIAYSEDNVFRKGIHRIFLKSCMNRTRLKLENPKFDYFQFCLSFSKNLSILFKDVYKTTLDTSIKRETFSETMNDLFFYYHIYLEEQKIYLILSPEIKLLNTPKFTGITVENDKSGKKYDLEYAVGRHKIVFGYCERNVIFVENEQHLRDILLIDKINENKVVNNIPLLFDIKVSTLSLPSLIYEFFYTLISFIESAGISYEQLVNLYDKILQDSTLDEEHKDIFITMMIYWKFMNQYFHENKIYKFSNLLKYFSDNNIQFFEFAKKSIRSMKNILVDEFQDISPEIVSFIRGAQKYLSTEDNQTTLMCIGDDWQSIYGWRGSSPSYLIDFKKHFNCKHDALVMSKNFRSSQIILSKAGKILDKTKIKLDKEVIAFNDYKDSVFKKVPIESKHYTERIPNIIEDINERILKIREEWPKAKIYVLSRKKSEAYKGVKGADKIMTFHSSKGLEADVCFLIGDCFYKDKDIVRNLIYRLAKYNQTYDESQYDEQLRLAYVAATRAKKHAYWYGLEESEFGYLLENV